MYILSSFYFLFLCSHRFFLLYKENFYNFLTVCLFIYFHLFQQYFSYVGQPSFLEGSSTKHLSSAQNYRSIPGDRTNTREVITLTDFLYTINLIEDHFRMLHTKYLNSRSCALTRTFFKFYYKSLYENQVISGTGPILTLGK